MSAISYTRGHEISYKNNEWVYVDDDTPIINERPCKHCGKMPTAEGYDACLGHIEGVKSACCGHGKYPSICIAEKEEGESNESNQNNM